MLAFSDGREPDVRTNHLRDEPEIVAARAAHSPAPEAGFLLQRDILDGPPAGARRTGRQAEGRVRERQVEHFRRHFRRKTLALSLYTSGMSA